MSLSCDCDYFYYYSVPDDDFSKSQKDCKCNSCKKKIKAGETVLKFTCWRLANPYSENPIDIQAYENSEDVYLLDVFHCERCGEIYLNLQYIGYFVYSNDYMPGVLYGYSKMIEFNSEKYNT